MTTQGKRRRTAGQAVPADIEARLVEHDDLVERFAQGGDPSVLAELIEEVTGVEVTSVKVTRPRRDRRAAAG